LEDELVVLHVFFRVRLQICSDLVEIEAVLVSALLPVHEELAELGGAEGRSKHAIKQVELVHRLFKVSDAFTKIAIALSRGWENVRYAE
jgi:hypothetical protein